MKTVHLFVFDGLADWEPSFAIAGLSHPPSGGEPRYRVATVGLTADPVRTMGAMRVLPDTTLDQLDPGDSALLILSGGTGADASSSSTERTRSTRKARTSPAAWSSAARYQRPTWKTMPYGSTSRSLGRPPRSP